MKAVNSNTVHRYTVKQNWSITNNYTNSGNSFEEEAAKGPLSHRVKQPPM